MVEQGYADLDFHWPEFPGPGFVMDEDWSLESFEGYLGTWSAVQRYMADRGDDPVAAIHARLSLAWGERRRRVTWPLVVRTFRIN
jgi:hypothetical protein